MTIIETARLRLRDPIENDAATLAREVGNLNVSRNLARVPHPYNVIDALDFLEYLKTRHPRSLTCAIEVKSNPGLMIGMMGYEVHEDKDNAEFGYWLAEGVWGNGFGKEAAQAIVYHAFMVTMLNQLVSAFHNDNPASARILKGLGFEKTGHVMQFSKAQGIEIASTTLKLNRNQWLEKSTTIS